MMRKFWVVLCVLLLAGCASLYGLRAPDVSVADVRLTGGTLFEQRFTLQLRVENSNDRDLTINGLVFDLQLADKDFAHGISNTTTTIPRFGSAIVEVEATAKTYNLLRHIPKLPDSTHLNYRLKGEAMTAEFGRIPFDRKGDIELPWKSLKEGLGN